MAVMTFAVEIMKQEIVCEWRTTTTTTKAQMQIHWMIGLGTLKVVFHEIEEQTGREHGQKETNRNAR